MDVLIPKHDNRNFLLLIPMDVGLVAKPLIYLLLVFLVACLYSPYFLVFFAHDPYFDN